MKNRIYLLPYRIDFIKYIADLLLDKNRDKDFAKFALVFPGRRPSLYLKKYLQESLQSPFIPPITFSMDEFIYFLFSKISPDFTKGKELDFAWFLFKCNMSGEIIISEKAPESFSKSLPFILALLKSIDELDMELVPDEKLSAIRYLTRKSSDTKIDSLYTIRKKLHDYFLETKTASRGFAYRRAALEISNIPLDEFMEIYFCGHFALTASEAKILRHLIERGNTKFYTQMEQNIPDIFKNTLDKLNGEPEFIEKERQIKRTIRYYSAPDIHTEVQKAGECLLNESDVIPYTAVVLPEESCLIPFLNCVMTRTTTDFNVTMGFPLSRTPHYNLLEAIITAQENRTGDGYYARDYLNVILNPYIKNIGINGHPGASRLLNNKIKELVIKRRMTFVKPEDIENLTIPGGGDVCAETVKILKNIESSPFEIEIEDIRKFLHNVLHRYFFLNFEGVETLNSFLDKLRESLILLINSEKSLAYPLSKDIFKKLSEYLESLRSLTFGNERIGTREIFEIILKTLKQERIPFEGYPLKGLQILGLLETRNLRFKNLIFLNLNEGIVPASNKYDPFLSIPIRKELNLPTHTENEEIYRYHFRRLIDGCDKVSLFYIQNDEMIRSRFIEELIWEEQKEKKKLEEPATEEIAINTVISPFPSPEIKKDDLSLEKIYKKITEEGLSPTALDRYMNCPLSFYYYYVLGLEEREGLSAEIEAKDIGNLIHKILEKFFIPFKGKQVTINEKIHKKELDKIAEEVFIQFFPYSNKGEIYLLKKIVQFRLDKFFTKLKTSDGPIEILETEEKIIADFHVKENISVKLQGHIDRIEKRKDNYVIIDYKTGEVEGIKVSSKRLLEIGKPLTREEAKKYIKSFQLPVYLYLLAKETNEKDWTKLDAVIYDIRKNMEIPLLPHREDYPQLMEGIILPTLRNIILEILSPHVPFFKDDSREKGCAFCPFAVLCRKM